MKQEDLVRYVAQETGYTKTMCREVVKSLSKQMREAFLVGDCVRFDGMFMLRPHVRNSLTPTLPDGTKIKGRQIITLKVVPSRKLRKELLAAAKRYRWVLLKEEKKQEQEGVSDHV